MYNLRKTKSRDASMRSRSNSSMNVDESKPNTKVNADKNELISEHDSEYVRYSQSTNSKAHQVEEEKKLQYSADSSPLNQFLVPAIFTEKVKNVIQKKKMILK